MSAKKVKKIQPKESRIVEIEVPAHFQSELLKLQHSPLFDELERFALSLNKYQDTFKSIALAQQRLIDSAFLPMTQLAETLNTIGNFQTKIAEDIQRISFVNDKAIQNIVNYQSIAQRLVLNSGILEITNSFKGLQIEAFAGIVVKGNLQKTIERVNNGITEVSTIRNTQVMAGGMVRLDIDKNTNSSFTAQVAYQKIETIGSTVQILDKNLVITNQKIESLEQQQKDFMAKIEDNPFPFFKIKKIDFITKKSQFLINGQIVVELPQYSRMEDLCNVLFSGHQELGETWFLDTIKESWATLIDNDKASGITWKQLLTTVEAINTLFAKKTTKEDLILVQRPQMIRLNPAYFS